MSPIPTPNPFVAGATHPEFSQRCMEISMHHVSRDSVTYLERWIEQISWMTRAAFEAFRINHDGAYGVRLRYTPWDEDDEELHSDLRRLDMPGDLLQVLLQAGYADVRLLVLDPDAGELEGLPAFD